MVIFNRVHEWLSCIIWYLHAFFGREVDFVVADFQHGIHISNLFYVVLLFMCVFAAEKSSYPKLIYAKYSTTNTKILNVLQIKNNSALCGNPV